MADTQKIPVPTRRSYYEIRVEHRPSQGYFASINLHDAPGFTAAGDNEREAVRNLFKEILHEEERDSSS
jgi:hypothetical protein